jgi:hypothetical protein
MKLIDVDSKATLEDFLTLKKTELVQFLWKCIEQISGNKNELAFPQRGHIMATSFSGGRSQSTRREPPTMGKQLVNFITCGCESSAPFFVIYKAGCEPTPYW